MLNKNLILIGKTDDGYSIYENPDVELKKEILEIEIPDYIYYKGDNYKFLKALNNGKSIFENNEGECETISNDYVEKLKRNTLIKKINEKYNVFDTMDKYIMPIYFERGILNTFNSKQRNSLNMDDPKSVGWFYKFERWVFYKTLIDDEGRFSLDYDTSSSGSLYFGVDGNIYNRDYNMNLNNATKDKHQSKQECLTEFITELSNFLGESELRIPKKENNDVIHVFSNKWAFHIDDYDKDEIDIRFSKIISGDSYQMNYKKHKIPKTLISISKENLLNEITEKAKKVLKLS